MTTVPTRATAHRDRRQRMRLCAVGFAAALIAAACAPEQPDEPVPGTELEAPAEEPTEATEPAEAPAEEPSEELAPPEDEEAEEPDDGTEQLEGEATTQATDEGQFGVVAVTDVRMATHAGFDRLVFEIEGDGLAGWDLRYVDEAAAQGTGEPIEVDGDAILAVALHNVTLPPDLPEGIDRWDEQRLDGPAGGVIDELVHDTIFEGIQTFFVGLDEERAFVVERFEDPQRVVIDILHDGENR